MSEYRRSIETSWNPALLLIPGWISAIASIFIFPFIFGAAGVVFGIFSSRNGRAGIGLIWVSMLCMAAGVIKNVFL